MYFANFRPLPISVILALIFPCAAALADEAASDSREVSFNLHVRPILSNHCFACHGPDEENREADLRLDMAGDDGLPSADPEEILARINSTDPDEIMPPAELHKPLKPKQIETFRQWIESGAAYQQHWAFIPAQAHDAPELELELEDPLQSWNDRSIDRFVMARLQSKKRTPKSRADRRTLIRRATFDLTGLPPTVEQIHAFLDDESDKAYENLIDRLIDAPQYGEHMARYWLDLVRFADTNGLHHDHYREMTPYRDWVIRAFNDNLAFDEFIKWQLAGDLYDTPTEDQKIASGFNRLHLIIDVGTALPQESLHRNVVDRVSAVGTAFMGLTLQCAACHDHKYDPITQKEFYQLYAFFNNFDGNPETGSRNGLDFERGLQPPYLNLPTEEQQKQLDQLDQELADFDSRIEKLKAEHQQQLEAAKAAAELARAEAQADANTKTESIKATEPKKEQTEQELRDELPEDVKLLIARREEKQAARDAVQTEVPAALVMQERAEVRPTHVLIRGVYDQPGEEVNRDTPAFLPSLKKDGVKTRMDLAKWLVEPTHPLTARVTVNRIWQQFFGVGLVRTSEDFGAQGEPPLHPQLLDHLATEFASSGWDVKSLVRSIVLSQTYQQSSIAPTAEYLADPNNRLLARGSRFRLDAEVIRDQVLAVSGQLNATMHGRSVKPPQPEGLWKIVAMPSSYPNVFQPDSGDRIYRRSIYTFWKRGLPPPQMTIFDAPTRESCIARRERTNTPLQALLMMNEEQYFSAAKNYASQLIAKVNMTDAQRISHAYEAITSHAPDDALLSGLQNALKEFQELYRNDPAAAKAMTGREDPTQAAEQAAWTMLVHSMLNLDTTKTHE